MKVRYGSGSTSRRLPGYKVIRPLEERAPLALVGPVMVFIVAPAVGSAISCYYSSMNRSSLPIELIAPPRTAGIPPPGCTDAPTLHSQGRLRSEYGGRWNGPLRHTGRTAP